MHAIRVLQEDHERIEALLSELAGADRATQTRLAEHLSKELVIHTVAEDNIFLAHVEDAVEDSKRTTGEFFGEDVLADASGLVAETYKQNGRIRDLLRRPLQDDIDGVERAVKDHVELEEELFPKARQLLEEEDFERIGDLIEHCKWQVRGLNQASLASSSSFRPAPVVATSVE